MANEFKMKTVYKWLRKQCSKLPPETYKAFHKYIEPIKEINKEEGGGFTLRTGYLEDHPVNHYRRCKKLFKQNGLEAVSKYFLQKGYEMQKGAK